MILNIQQERVERIISIKRRCYQRGEFALFFIHLNPVPSFGSKRFEIQDLFKQEISNLTIF